MPKQWALYLNAPHAYTVRDGKVVSVRMYEDTQAQAAAFGAGG